MSLDRVRLMPQPYSTEKLVYSLSNHTCSGRSQDVINTGLKIYNKSDFPYGFRIEFSGIVTRVEGSSGSNSLPTWFACMDESGNPYPGFVIRVGYDNGNVLQAVFDPSTGTSSDTRYRIRTGNTVNITIEYDRKKTTATISGTTFTVTGETTLDLELLIGATWNSTATGYMRYGYVQIDSLKVYKLQPKKSSITYGNFGGLMFSPGPLVYENGGFRIQNTWDEVTSYGSKYGKTNGSTYFRESQLPTGYLTFGDFTDWKAPTQAQLKILVGTISGYARNGSTVNGNTRKHFCRVLTNITFHGTPDIWGYIFFPDDKTITGKTISYFDTTTATEGFTYSDINNYVKQGCVFLPTCGFYRSGFGQGESLAGSYTISWADSYNCYTLLLYDGSYTVDAKQNESAFYYPCIMCRTV